MNQAKLVETRLTTTAALKLLCLTYDRGTLCCALGTIHKDATRGSWHRY